MAVVTLEEAKQYLRVDSADEDGFISGLLETGESMCADMARMEAGELEGIFPWRGLPSCMSLLQRCLNISD